jgi:hypothetical protein
VSMANCLQGMQTNGGGNGAFGSMNLTTATSDLGSALSAGFSGGSSPSGTQQGPGFNLGAATDQLEQTGLNAASQTVPVWTASLFGQQSQNQLNEPTYSGLGTQPGLTTGAGPVLPGPQPAGGIPAPSGFSTKTLLIIGAIAVGLFLLMKE